MSASSSPREAAALPELTIRPRAGWRSLDLAELWRYRELLWFLAARDVRVRYKQTALGAAWAVLQPLATMIVFTVFFGRLAGMPSGGVPYAVFALAALLPWQLFAQALASASNSIVDNQNLVTKAYFPRLLMPLAATAAALVDFAVAFALLVGALVVYGIPPRPAVLALPLFILLAVAAALAVGIWLSALNALYRDFRYTIPFLVQLWLFATPVAYPSSIVPARWRALYGLNPMAGVVEGFRWSILGQGDPPGAMVAISAAVVAASLVGGLLYFRRVERTLADWV